MRLDECIFLGLTLGPEAGVCRVARLGLCLAYLQLWLLEVFGFFLLALGRRPGHDQPLSSIEICICGRSLRVQTMLSWQDC